MTMLAATVNIPTWLAVIVSILGGTGTVSAGWAIARQKSITASLDTIKTINEELRASNKELREKLVEERIKRAELEGRLTIFVDQFAERIVTAVMETWRRTHQETIE